MMPTASPPHHADTSETYCDALSRRVRQALDDNPAAHKHLIDMAIAQGQPLAVVEVLREPDASHG